MEIVVSNHVWCRYRDRLGVSSVGGLYEKIRENVRQAQIVSHQDVRMFGFKVSRKSWCAFYEDRIYILKWKPQRQQLIVMTVYGPLESREIEFFRDHLGCPVEKKFRSRK